MCFGKSLGMGSETRGRALGKLGDATQKLYGPVQWEWGATNAQCHPWAQHSPAPDIPLALGQQLLIWEAALCAWRTPQAPAGTSTAKPGSDTEQINALLWFWALEGYLHT